MYDLKSIFDEISFILFFCNAAFGLVVIFEKFIAPFLLQYFDFSLDLDEPFGKTLFFFGGPLENLLKLGDFVLNVPGL